MLPSSESSPEEHEELEAQEVINAYEEWRNGGLKPDAFIQDVEYAFIFVKRREDQGNSYWIVPDLVLLNGTNPSYEDFITRFYPMPEGISVANIASLSMQRPAWVRNLNDVFYGHKIHKGELI